MKVRSLSSLSSKDKVQLAILSLVWLGANFFYWSWWLSKAQSGNMILFLVFSVASGYILTFLPSMYLFYLWNMAHPEPITVQQAVDAGVIGHVAMITLTVVGAESMFVVEKQLQAMVQVKYPHDSWLLVDGKHSAELEQLCKKYGVFYFSRHNVELWGENRVQMWNAPHAPFQKKTKAGNVNAWISGAAHIYTHFVQLDIDHRPKPDYLDKTLGYFADSKIKWVQAPSVYGNMEHWTARGSAEQELVLQGPLQSGFFGWSKTPFIIGSHCTYSMEAVVNIKGFQPTRAEDHLDTVEMAAKGYRGVFLPEIIAVGDGPEDFETYLGQQFAWAYSLMTILFWHTPRLIPKYGPKRVIQILFAQTWYPLWSISMLVLFLLPAVGLVTGRQIASVGYWEYILHSSAIAIVGWGLWKFSAKWHQPQGLKLSWRGVILHIARWPIVVSALVQVIMKVEKPYMITPKGQGVKISFPLRTQVLYLVLMLVNFAAILYAKLILNQGTTYTLFALQGAVFLYLVFGMILARSPWCWQYVFQRKTALATFGLLSAALVGIASLVSTSISIF